MIRVRDLRFLTALATIAMAGLAIRSALGVVGFGLAETFGADSDRFAAYSDAPGAGSFAREALLRQSEEGQKALDVATDLLSVRPLSAGDWLGLARLDIVSRTDLKAGLSALAMSNVTGPNEGSVMASRAALLVPLWSVLPAEVRRTGIDDLVRGWVLMGAPERLSLTDAVATMPPIARANLQAGLLLAGVAAAPVLRALGLDQFPQPGVGAPAGQGPGLGAVPSSAATVAPANGMSGAKPLGPVPPPGQGR